jgi:hypothetical protein
MQSLLPPVSPVNLEVNNWKHARHPNQKSAFPVAIGWRVAITLAQPILFVVTWVESGGHRSMHFAPRCLRTGGHRPVSKNKSRYNNGRINGHVVYKDEVEGRECRACCEKSFQYVAARAVSIQTVTAHVRSLAAAQRTVTAHVRSLAAAQRCA